LELISGNNSIKIDFQAISSFKNRYLVIDVVNISEIYDLHGNLMHKTRAEFLINNYAPYDDKTKKTIGLVGALGRRYLICFS